MKERRGKSNKLPPVVEARKKATEPGHDMGNGDEATHELGKGNEESRAGETASLREIGEERTRITERTWKTPNDNKLSDSGVRRGTCMVGGKAAVEAGAVTHGAVRCSAWLGVTFWVEMLEYWTPKR